MRILEKSKSLSEFCISVQKNHVLLLKYKSLDMQKITKNKVVSINYKLYESNKEGEVLEEVSKERPFVFLFGSGYLLPKFEAHLEGKEVKHSFEFHLDAADAYGDYIKEHVIDVPKSIFEENKEVPLEEILFVGNMIPMEDEEGYPLTGVIKEIKEEAVTMDFNHPMAGKELYFEGSVLDIRDATDEELAHGHVHGNHGHHGHHDHDCSCQH
ncbi:MAG: peptidylprolyl isomerase [Bacteroidetes bacterium]|nr:MAG: peptidylprolyl isomerase [Bacteroidota bacterium]